MRTSSAPAFTLVELLAVIALIAILASAAVPAMSSLSRSGSFNQSLIEISGLLSQARQYAVAQNTYVWVALRPDTALDNSLSVIVLSSKNGQDPTPWTDYGTAPSSLIGMMGKPRTFTQIRLEDAGTFTAAKITGLPASPSVTVANSLAAGTASFSVRLPGNSTPETFDHVVQFTPDGQARVAAGSIDVVEFGLRPMKGTSPEENNVAVLRINGLTGKTFVYQP